MAFDRELKGSFSGDRRENPIKSEWSNDIRVKTRLGAGKKGVGLKEIH